MKKLVRMAALAGTVALAGATSAHAGSKVMATAPALAGYPSAGTRTIYCTMTNIGKVSADVVFEVLDYSGNTLQGPFTITLAPNTGNAVGDSTGNGVWCRFTVPGSTKSFRGTALYDNGTDYEMSIPAQ